MISRDYLERLELTEDQITLLMEAQDKESKYRRLLESGFGKRIISMKKVAFAVICFLLAVCLCACGGNVKDVKTHEVESTLFSQDEICSAIDVIENEFRRDWKGCTLT